MNKQFKVGEYVHIPEQTIVWDMDDGGDIKSYVKMSSPAALMLVGIKQDVKFAGSIVYEVFYEGKVFSVTEDNVYVLEEK